MMGTGLAQVVDDSMRRAHLLEQQRAAAGIVLAKYGVVEGVERWAHTVLVSDEIQRYRLLYVIADRGVSA